MLPTLLALSGAAVVARAQSNNSPEESSSGSSSGLTGGQIAGIVVGVVVGALLLIGLGIWFLWRRRRVSNSSRRSGAVDSRKLSGASAGSGVPLSNADADADAVEKGQVHRASDATGGQGASNEGDNGADNRNTSLVAFYRDTNQSREAFITPGSNVYVLYPYNAGLPDELTLVPDQVVRVTRIYDDSWAAGQILGSSFREGAFPLVCVTLNADGASSVQGSQAPRTPSIRTSSASVRSRNSYRSTYQTPSEGGRSSWIAPGR